jgi:Tol biopolymer transport system component
VRKRRQWSKGSLSPLPALRPAALAGSAALVAVLALPGSASAVFPGDNGRIAYENHDIFTIRASGEDKRNLTRDLVGGSRDRSAHYPAYSADGERIAFVLEEGRLSRSTSLYVMNANGTQKTEITARPGATQPAFSPDGESLVYAAEAGIFAADLSGNSEHLTRRGSSPTFSPNGRRIAFVRGDDIWTMNATGSEQVNLTRRYPQRGPHGRFFDAPDFSPNGRRIVLISDFEAASSYGVYVMRADGRKLKALTRAGDRPEETAASYSPDGGQIVFERFGRRRALYVMDSDGGRARRVAALGGFSTGAADWQPVSP